MSTFALLSAKEERLIESATSVFPLSPDDLGRFGLRKQRGRPEVIEYPQCLGKPVLRADLPGMLSNRWNPPKQNYLW